MIPLTDHKLQCCRDLMSVHSIKNHDWFISNNPNHTLTLNLMICHSFPYLKLSLIGCSQIVPRLIFIIALQNIVCVYTYICMYVYVHIHIYIYIYTTHTYHYNYIHSIPFRSPVLLMFVLLNFPKAGA